jgi:hypothetical protein
LLLLTLFVAFGAGYLLLETDNGQRLMATWEWSIADSGAYVSLAQELIDQAYFTRALEKLESGGYISKKENSWFLLKGENTL